MSQPSHFDLGQQLGHITGILEPIPKRLDDIEEKWNAEMREIKTEIASLKEQRSHFMGIGVGIGATMTFIAGAIATFGKEILFAFAGKSA